MTVYNKASLVLAESPAYKAGKIQPYYPLTPDVSFDFTRATSATRVNASGNIEKETQNLLLQSNQFDTTWATSGTSVTSGQSGYDGTNNAWLLTKTTIFSNIKQSLNQSNVCTFSVYAKANTYSWLLLHIEDSAGDALVSFNLNDGSIGSQIQNIYASTESVGNGWYRCSITALKNATEFRIYPNESNGYSGEAGSIYIQDAQLEQGLVARDYQETTTSEFYGGITDNVPRLDYTDGSCPSVLLEPQRTNIAINSEYISGIGAPLAIQSSGFSISYNQVDSPEGVSNSMKWTEGTNNGTHWGSVYLTGLAVGQDVTISIFAKRGTSNDRDLVINVYDGSTSDRAKYNLSTGVVVTDSSGSNDADVSMVDYGNGWWRCIYTRNLLASGYNAVMGMSNGTEGGSETYQGNGTSNIYTYGLQVEAGSYATSYIPTYGTSVTRNVDGLPLLGVSEFGQLTSLENGTAFFEAKINALNTQNRYLYIARGSLAHFWSTTSLYLYNTGGGFLQWGSLPNVTTLQNTSVKIAFKKEGLNVTLFINGTNYGVRTIASGETIDAWEQFTTYQGGSQSIKKYLEFSTALTDDECIALTTL